MEKKNWKRGITIFSIFLLWGLMHDSPIMRCLIVIALVGGLSLANLKIAKEKKVPVHYRFSFVLFLVSAACLLVIERLWLLYVLLICTIAYGMLALYRTCYPYKLDWKGLKQIAQDIYQLCFMNITDYFMLLDTSMKAEKKRNMRIAAVLASIVTFVVLVGLGSRADIYFAYSMQMMFHAVYNQLPYIGLSILFGSIMASFLYGYIVGLMLDQVKLNPKWYFQEECLPLLSEKRENFLDGLFHSVCPQWVLNMVIFCNCIFVGENLFSYWNPLRWQLELAGGSYYSDGLAPAWIWILANCCILGIIQRYFSRYDNESLNGKADDWVEEKADTEILLKKIKRRLILAELTSIGIWIFTIARFIHLIYESGIKYNNYLWLPCIVATGMGLGEFLWMTLKKWGEVSLGPCIIRGIGILIVVMLVWNKCFFPTYNMLLFQEKYESGNLANFEVGLDKELIVISKDDIDLFYMETSGKYAIPALTFFLDKNNPYGETGYSVSEVALKCLESICINELEDDNQRIKEAVGIDKLRVIEEIMENDSAYSIGYRAYCLQAIKECLSRLTVDGEIKK